MSDQRALDTLKRIEQALARVETAATNRPPPAAPAPDADVERLREAHEKLRQRVAGAIGEIDRLIEAGSAR
jgi:hypothetical protein